MPTDKSEYWQRRAKERADYWTRKSKQTIERELARYYRESLKKIEGDIAALYTRFAEQTELSLKDAKSLLRGKEFQEWRMDLKAYVAEIQNLETLGKTAEAKALLKELDTLAMRSRISRLDALHAETVKELLSLGGKIDAKTAAFLKEIYPDNYYKTLFDIGKMGELKTVPAKVDPKRLEAVLRERWSGKNYSENIWKDTKKLSEVLQKTVLQGVYRGFSVDRMTAEVAKKMESGRNNAERIVRTEMTYVQNQAALDGVKDAGFAFYRYVAAHDSRTCQRCGDKDGLTVAVDEADVGSNLPPLHPRCRCTIIADFGDGKSIGKKRVARDRDGKNIHIPADMQYKDWKAVYIDKTKTLADWTAANDGRLAAVTKKVLPLAANEVIIGAIDNDLSKLSKIVGDHSAEEDLQAVNPHRDEGEEWRNNCQRCVPTYELRRRGYNVTAKPRSVSDIDDYLSKGNHYFHMFENPQVIQCKGNGFEDVKYLLKQWGNNARAEIQVAWKNKLNQGHLFVAENRNGKIVFLDPQTGRVNVENYFLAAKEGYTTIHRMDNLQFNERIWDCCEEVKK